MPETRSPPPQYVVPYLPMNHGEQEQEEDREQEEKEEHEEWEQEEKPDQEEHMAQDKGCAGGENEDVDLK